LNILRTLSRLTVLLIFTCLFLSCRAAPLKNNRTIEKYLQKNRLSYDVDAEGDFMVTYRLEDRTEQTVWIRGQMNYSGEEPIREVFSVGAVLDQEQVDYLSRYLLLDNFQTRVMGSWALLENDSDSRAVLLYVVKSPLNAGPDYLESALRETAYAAEIMKSVIPLPD